MSRTVSVLLAVFCFPLHTSSAVHTLPAPTITWRVDPSTGAAYEIDCSAPGEYRGCQFRLFREGTLKPVRVKKVPHTDHSVVFIVANVTLGPGEQYRCQYSTRTSGSLKYSNISRAVNVTLEQYPKPSISLIPRNPILNGGSATICCQGLWHNMVFALYKGQTLIGEQEPKDQLPIVKFPLQNVGPLHRGLYNCFYYRRDGNGLWSEASDVLQLRVTGVPYEPANPQGIRFHATWEMSVNCSITPGESGGGWVYLYREGEQEPLARQRTPALQTETFPMTFDITQLTLGGPGEKYGCLYKADEGTEVGAHTGQEHVAFSKADPETEETSISTENVVRIGLAALILLVALIFVIQACLET
ncbi:T-cell-interacting, activating receptor on myeloid cells protein 1-like [Lissotriton helveticus]